MRAAKAVDVESQHDSDDAADLDREPLSEQEQATAQPAVAEEPLDDTKPSMERALWAYRKKQGLDASVTVSWHCGNPSNPPLISLR